MSAEEADRQQAAANDWRPLIADAMPERFGIRFGDLLEAVHDPWLAMADRPCSAMATAVTALACAEVLEINGQVIRRGPMFNQQERLSG